MAAGAPSELNIDHSLRHKLDGRMTQTENDADRMRVGLQKAVELMELASESVAKLMASVSICSSLCGQVDANHVLRTRCLSFFAIRNISQSYENISSR